MFVVLAVRLLKGDSNIRVREKSIGKWREWISDRDGFFDQPRIDHQSCTAAYDQHRTDSRSPSANDLSENNNTGIGGRNKGRHLYRVRKPRENSDQRKELVILSFVPDLQKTK